MSQIIWLSFLLKTTCWSYHYFLAMAELKFWIYLFTNIVTVMFCLVKMTRLTDFQLLCQMYKQLKEIFQNDATGILGSMQQVSNEIFEMSN